MFGLLRFDLKPMAKLEIKTLQYFCIINLIVLGLIYGYSASVFSKIVIIEKGYDLSDFNAIKIILAGIPVAFLLHAGASLFIWVFLRAIGGKANFINAYFNIGVASISLWGLAPFVAALQVGNQMPALIGFTALFALYAFIINVLVIKKSFQLSQIKMAIATSVTIVYISSFLYLWV